MEWIEHNAKPDLDSVNAYFQKRLHEKKEQIVPFPFMTSQDTFNNAVYTSTKKTEEILSGEYPATLIVTNEGKSLIQQNPTFLSQVSKGSIMGELIGEGQEGKVYKIALQTSTGTSYFALKYTYPIHNGGELGVSDIYTPGIDQMRIMQLAEKDNPVPGVRFATPHIATLDITLSPFIPDTISARLLKGQDHLSEQSKNFLRDIVGNQTLGEIHSPFMEAYSKSVGRIGQHFETWFDNKQHLPTISKHLSYDNGNADPFLVSVPDLHSLYKRFCENPKLIEKDYSQEFDQAVNECVFVTELAVGM